MMSSNRLAARPGAAIVLGTGVVSLGVLHDFAAEQIPVIHISTKDSDIALRSRLSQDKIVIADGSQQVVELLLQRAEAWRGAALFPTVDPLLVAVSRNLDRLAPHYRTVVQPWSTLEGIVDKNRLYETAHAIGLPAPQVIPVAGGVDPGDWVRSIGFPVIIKPRQTPPFFRAFKRKAFEAHDERELLTLLDAVLAKGLEVMVSEIIPGDVKRLYCYRAYVARDGHVAAEMCSQKLRTHPAEYGVGRVQRTVPMIEELRVYGRRLLDELGFRGYATIEFKLDPRDATFKLIEINPRPALCQQLFRAAGMNFAYLAYLDMHDRPLPPMSYEPNVYVIHNTDELHYLRSALRGGFKGIREFLGPYREKRKVYMIPFRNDPRPLLYQLRRMVGWSLRQRGLGSSRASRMTSEKLA
jgi:D-aspartate ligase